MTPHADALPRYSEIEATLRTRIARMAPGDPLPSDAQLCEEFGVSRMTARAAVRALVDDGLVERVTGRGTFVSVSSREESETLAGELECATALWRLLAEVQQATSVRLAKTLGMRTGEVDRLLARMELLGLVERGPRSSFRLGLGLFRLGSAVLGRFDVRQAALPVMERINERTEQTINLCIRRDFDAVCIERLDGRWVRSMALQIGGSLPLHVGAAPRALLAAEPRSFWEEYVRMPDLETRTPRTPVTPAAILAELEQIDATGYAVSDRDVVPGIASLGAPIHDHGGHTCAAMSMGGLRDQVLGDELEANVALIVSGAAEISRALGAPGNDRTG